MNSICPKSRNCKSAKSSRQELIDRIAIGVAHEIRNPLTVIKGYLQLQERKSTYCRGESLDIIYQEVNRIEALAANIIALAKSKAIKKTPVNLNGLLEKIYPVIQQAAGQKGIVTELLLSDDLPMLELNAEEIEQLVINLASNGIEAMQANGRLTIGAVRKSSRVVLYIKDEGSGIPADRLEQIFDPFYTTKECNTGLGLAVSRSIVERHHGKIRIVSTLGGGTIFKILFPILGRQ